MGRQGEERLNAGQIMETYEAISQAAVFPLRSMWERQQSFEHKRNMIMTYSLRQELKNIFCKEPDSVYLGFVVSVGTTRLCRCQWKEVFLVTSVMSDSVRLRICQPTRLCHPWDSPGKNTGVGCHLLLQCMKVKSKSEVAQSCLTLCDPMD